MKTILILFTILLFSFTVNAQKNDFWVELERPTQDRIGSIAVTDDNTIYAGTKNVSMPCRKDLQGDRRSMENKKKRHTKKHNEKMKQAKEKAG